MFDTIKKDWKGILTQAAITAFLMVGMIWGLSIVLGAQQNTTQEQQAIGAIACILRIPPDERTIADTDACFARFGIVIPDE